MWCLMQDTVFFTTGDKLHHKVLMSTIIRKRTATLEAIICSRSMADFLSHEVKKETFKECLYVFSSFFYSGFE